MSKMSGQYSFLSDLRTTLSALTGRMDLPWPIILGDTTLPAQAPPSRKAKLVAGSFGGKGEPATRAMFHWSMVEKNSFFQMEISVGSDLSRP